MFTLAFAVLAFVAQGPDSLAKPKPPEPQLVSTDVTVGKGDGVVAGDIVKVDYTGTLADGTVFDSSKKAGGKPFSVVVGIGLVIKGWDQGLIGMKAGGTRKLIIPPSLAYGERGAPGVIPPNSTLTFTIDAISIEHVGNKLKIEITKAGTGPEVKLGDDLVVKATCKGADGKVFFTTDTGAPKGAPFKLGATRFIPGFTLGVIGMKAGEVRTLTVPPELGLAENGQKQFNVKPNETITIDAELVSIGVPTPPSGGKETRQ